MLLVRLTITVGFNVNTIPHRAKKKIVIIQRDNHSHAKDVTIQALQLETGSSL